MVVLKVTRFITLQFEEQISNIILKSKKPFYLEVQKSNIILTLSKSQRSVEKYTFGILSSQELKDTYELQPLLLEYKDLQYLSQESFANLHFLSNSTVSFIISIQVFVSTIY